MQLQIFEDDAPGQVDDAEVIDYRAERNFARAAEFLVAYNISLRGWDCFAVAEGLRYDLIADIRGLRRVQVKMNRRARHMSAKTVEHRLSRKSGYLFGKGDADLREYSGDVDLFAFVAMDQKLILYSAVPSIKRAHLWISAESMTAERCDLSWKQATQGWVDA